MLPRPSKGLGAQRSCAETQQSGHTPRSALEVKVMVESIEGLENRQEVVCEVAPPAKKCFCAPA